MSWLSLGAAAHMACKKSINFVGDRWRMVRLVSMKPDNLDDGFEPANDVRHNTYGNYGRFPQPSA